MPTATASRRCGRFRAGCASFGAPIGCSSAAGAARAATGPSSSASPAAREGGRCAGELPPPGVSPDRGREPSPRDRDAQCTRDDAQPVSGAGDRRCRVGGAAQADRLQGAVGATDPHRGGSVVPEHPALQRVSCGAGRPDAGGPPLAVRKLRCRTRPRRQRGVQSRAGRPSPAQRTTAGGARSVNARGG